MGCYTSGDTTLTDADLPCLETILTNEVTMKSALGQTITSTGGQRASASSAGNPAPASSASTPTTFPPENHLPWHKVKTLMDADTHCVVCYSTMELHCTKGCPCIAAKGFVIVKDEVKAKALTALYTTTHPRRGAGRGGGRGGGRGNGGRGRGTSRPSARITTPTPTPPTPTPTAPIESGPTASL